ncbi:TIGR01777 family protein [Sediminibacterium roseum]|uniref:TIGR01777 family protein n=1 Tax=Sediminibacterium roseum TaxID=1978412 RepID=A0ABW9ZTR9_9BACT|nr:TIGR01777 family oxidoreductase [Sediminibacterium roseum]NCI49152.1 TIGR01777 family protein [Sediminibacterium roseum]
MSTILITGGTGMIGTQLAKLLLAQQHRVIVLTRDAHKIKHKHPGIRYANWDAGNQTIDEKAVADADHVIHLAGAGVADERWSEKRKKEIVESRTQSSALLVKAMHDVPNKIKTVVSASAIGWYGPDTEASREQGFVETQPADTAFLGETCRLWEESIEPVTALGKRLVKLRTGIVLSKTGGALEEFKKPLKAFVAAVLGDGKQIVSWIHIDDLCRMYIDAIGNENLHGVYNAVAPGPVSNKTLTIALAKTLRGNSFVTIHVPSFVLKAMLGEMSIEVLKSATVSSKKIEAAGFAFRFPTIGDALRDLVRG